MCLCLNGDGAAGRRSDELRIHESMDLRSDESTELRNYGGGCKQRNVAAWQRNYESKELRD